LVCASAPAIVPSVTRVANIKRMKSSLSLAA
jgi:hypothetical protein